MRKAAAFAIFLVLIFSAPKIFGEGSSAVLGTEDFFAGALPPPGFHFINYMAYYGADDLKDADGDHQRNPLGQKLDFKARVFADCLRGIYVSDIKILGADLAWHVIVPVVYRDVEIKGAFDEDEFGLGDIYFSPFVLGWHGELFHFIAGLDIIAPTGKYDENHNVNIGNNHWTFEPALAVSMIHPSGLSASVKLMYDIHTENDDSKYKTGQQIHLDYNVGLQIVDGLRLGICGYYLKGLEDDESDGSAVSDSEEQVLAAGPSAMYSFNPALHLVAKLQYEMEAENRPEGMFGWLKILYSF